METRLAVQQLEEEGERKGAKRGEGVEGRRQQRWR